MRVTVAVAAFGLGLAPMFGHAAPVTWDCAFEDRSNGWVGKEARYVIDEAAGTATVFDGAIQLIDKKPRAVKYRKKANGEHAMSWKVVGVPGHKKRTVEGTIRMDTEAKLNPKFWATLDPEKQSVKVRVKVGDATKTYWGWGSCKQRG